jgi:oligopeptidase A
MSTATNPLLQDSTLPAFASIRPEHVEEAVRTTLDANRERIRGIEACPTPTFAAVVEPLEELQHRLTRVWSPVGHLNGVMNSEALRERYNACLPLLSEYGTEIAQSRALYDAYAEVLAKEGPQLTEAQRAVVEHALRDFRLAGVALDGPKKERFKEIMLELSRLGAKFEENVLDATNAFGLNITDERQLAGINATVVSQARARAEKEGQPGWTFGLDQPTYVAIVTDGESPALRRAFYEAWSTRASDQGPSAGRFDNTAVMEDLLRLRHEAARLLDFPNYAAYALATRMAKSVDEVLGFLRRLAKAARPAAERELAELTAFAGRPLDAWDVTYYSERLQQERYSISQEELRPYFPLERVLAGLFAVIERLFDVRIQPRTDVELWHPDARYYDIFTPAGAQVGGFFLDPYARPHKRSGAWMDECVGRKDTSGGHTLPVAYLVCNALPGSEGKPALLTHDDVVTMFHEFGHGLHHLLTRVGYPSVAGINGVAWDAVELPSQFFENYAWHPQVLRDLSRHVETGESLPEATVAQLIRTRSYQAGLATLRQVEFALFDFRLHAEYDPSRSDGNGVRIREILAEVRSEVAVIRIPEWNRYPNNFGHIFAGGYAAGYYSYKWAEVLAADAFSAFTEKGVFDKDTARRFVDSILSRGGSRDALDNFVEFRGRSPDIQPLLQLHGIAA